MDAIGHIFEHFPPSSGTIWEGLSGSDVVEGGRSLVPSFEVQKVHAIPTSFLYLVYVD